RRLPPGPPRRFGRPASPRARAGPVRTTATAGIAKGSMTPSAHRRPGSRALRRREPEARWRWPSPAVRGIVGKTSNGHPLPPAPSQSAGTSDLHRHDGGSWRGDRTTRNTKDHETGHPVPTCPETSSSFFVPFRVFRGCLRPFARATVAIVGQRIVVSPPAP